MTIFGTLSENVLDLIADSLVNDGYVILNDVVPPTLSSALALQAKELVSNNQLKPAGIGRQHQHHSNVEVRTDNTLWFDSSSEPQAQYMALMEQLRVGINQRLFMGLFDYECHFAHYQENAFYRKHVDAFKGKTNRILSTVFYLNQDWREKDGGELLLYQHDQQEPFKRILPTMGTLVVFLSERFPHEVIAASNDRFSIAGWFRVNTVGSSAPAR